MVLTREEFMRMMDVFAHAILLNDERKVEFFKEHHGNVYWMACEIADQMAKNLMEGQPIEPKLTGVLSSNRDNLRDI